jgi:hypothetical protein
MLDDKDSVDQREDNPYKNRAYTCQWYTESGMIAEYVGKVSRERRGSLYVFSPCNGS